MGVQAPLAATTLTHVIEKGGVIVLALAVAAILSLPPRLGRRLRSPLIVAALLLTPVLLAVALWHNSKLAPLHHHPLEGIAAIVAALLIIAALAHLLDRRPALLPLLAIAALPFRIPLGTISDGLLVPLYAVIAAGSICHLARTWSHPQSEVCEGGRESGLPQHLLSAYLLLYAIQASYSTDLTKAVEQLGFFYVPFALLFFLLCGVRWDRVLLERCLWLIGSLAMLFVLVGFIELASGRLLFNRSLDADAYFVRINSLFYDPNIYGRFLALTMIVLTVALLFTRRRRAAQLAAGALALMWAGLALSLSQSSVVALLAGLAVAAVGVWGRRAAAVVAVLTVLGVAGALAIALHSNNSANDLTSGRSSLVRGGIDLFADRPLAGYGSGSFSTEYLAHVPKHRNSFERRWQLPVALPATTDSHTTAITIASEQGLVGLALYAALLIACFARLFGGRLFAPLRSSEGIARLAVAAAFTGLVVHTLFYADFLEDPTTWVLLAVGVALAPRRASPLPTATAPS
jgi:putative inorganic carbon (HCO3(-)) transporter